MIICDKQGKNPSRTVHAVERTQQDVPNFSSSIAKWWLNDLKDISQGQRPLYTTHPLMLVIICAWCGKNPSRTLWVTERTGNAGRMDWNQYTPPPPHTQHNTTHNYFLLWHSDIMRLCILYNIGWDNGLLPDGTKPLPEPLVTYHQLHHPERHFNEILFKIPAFPFTNYMHLKCQLQNVSLLSSASLCSSNDSLTCILFVDDEPTMLPSACVSNFGLVYLCLSHFLDTDTRRLATLGRRHYNLLWKE